MQSQDYCQYIITKCRFKACDGFTNRLFKCPNDFLNQYNNDRQNAFTAGWRNRRIIRVATKLINQLAEEDDGCGTDITELIHRCQQRIREDIEYDELFTVLSDFLWIIVSRKTNQLIDDSYKECRAISKYLEKFYEGIIMIEKSNRRLDPDDKAICYALIATFIYRCDLRRRYG